MDVKFKAYELKGLEQMNIILGKNGCGKSTLLREMEQERRNTAHVKYITPERGGTLQFNGNVETNRQNENWLSDIRRRNQSSNFRQVSVSEFRRLETLVLRKIERDKATRADQTITFQTTIDQINSLLDNIEIVRSENGAFQVRGKGEEEWRNVELISSGKSELISLAIEILSFAYVSDQDQYREKENWLLIDEPDVHLHPDLQYRFMKLLASAAAGKPFRVLIATHSTAIVSALSENSDVKLAFMGNGEKKLTFETVIAATKAVLPIFGAHPLSNVFNERPILLVEGEDDERIWQQASRSSEGAIRIWPCAAGDVQSLNEYEEKARLVIKSVYDDAKAFSLRDRDDGPYAIDDVGPVVRARLNCRSAENLIVTDDVLTSLNTDWPRMREALEAWLEQNEGHAQYDAVVAFRDNGWSRREANLKPLRNLLMAIAGSQKPWEVAVGQAIAALKEGGVPTGENSLTDFLGPKIVGALQLMPEPAEDAAPNLEAAE